MPQRGHGIIAGWPALPGFPTGPAGLRPTGGTAAVGIDASGDGKDGGSVGSNPAGAGRTSGLANAGVAGLSAASGAPQLRQYFIPGGFSARHLPHSDALGNPCGTAGVCARELPQFRQNDDPSGLSWPHIEQRIGPLTLNPNQVSQQPRSLGNGAWPVCNAVPGLLRRAGSVVANIAYRLAIHVALAGSIAAPSACVDTAVRTAPFRARPDAAEPGSLQGPFTGRVVDSTTHAPIAGALIYAAWTFERGTGLAEPAGFKELVGSTDAAGNYTVAKLGRLPGGTRVTEFTLLIYKRGFVAYRSDRRFSDLGLRMDFAQTDNQVLLERWRSDLSHARHLRFVGSGTAVAALSQWELGDASAELDGRRLHHDDDLRPGRSEGQYVVAAQLLTESDIKARTKYDGGFETGPLSDEPDTATYSSQHFKALGRPETWDVALRLWRLEAGKAQERYDELLTQLPGITEKDELANRSFIATENDIRGVGFLDAPRGIVVLLTCGSNQCISQDDANAMSVIIYNRIKTLLPTTLGGTTK